MASQKAKRANPQPQNDLSNNLNSSTPQLRQISIHSAIQMLEKRILNLEDVPTNSNNISGNIISQHAKHLNNLEDAVKNSKIKLIELEKENKDLKILLESQKKDIDTKFSSILELQVLVNKLSTKLLSTD